MAEPLPRQVNVMRVVTYNTDDIVQDIHADTGKPIDEIELHEVLDRIEKYAEEEQEFTDMSDLIWQDENGNDL